MVIIQALREVLPANATAAGLIQVAASNKYWPGSVAYVEAPGVAASATATLATVVAGNILTIGGVNFTAVASGAIGNQFNVGGNDNITATNLAAAINGSVTAGIAGVVGASSNNNVVTVSALTCGVAGNSITFAKTGVPITVSGANLAGGIDGAPGVKVIILEATDATHIRVKLHPDEGVSADGRTTRSVAQMVAADLSAYTTAKFAAINVPQQPVYDLPGGGVIPRIPTFW